MGAKVEKAEQHLKLLVRVSLIFILFYFYIYLWVYAWLEYSTILIIIHNVWCIKSVYAFAWLFDYMFKSV